jgi:class 3 adenylate cyclase
MNLAEWLKGLGLGQYADAFAENEIDFSLLENLTDADLKELGVAPLGHRKRLLAAIAQQYATPPAAAVHAEPATGERRQVTIMFTDLCGFTALSQSLDPEEVHELVIWNASSSHYR